MSVWGSAWGNWKGAISPGHGLFGNMQTYFSDCCCGWNNVCLWTLNRWAELYRFNVHTHTHTRLTALCPGLSRWAGTRKVKPIWILLKQETVSGSGISWAICKSAQRSRQITTPAPHHSESPTLISKRYYYQTANFTLALIKHYLD